MNTRWWHGGLLACLVQLLHKFSVNAADGNQKLLKVFHSYSAIFYRGSQIQANMLCIRLSNIHIVQLYERFHTNLTFGNVTFTSILITMDDASHRLHNVRIT